MGGLDLLLKIGIWAGVIIYIGKVYVFHLAFPQGMKYVNTHPLLLAIMDIAFTVILHKTIGTGSQMGILISASFGGCSTLYIFFQIQKKKFLSWWFNKSTKEDNKEINKEVNNAVESNTSTSSEWKRLTDRTTSI